MEISIDSSTGTTETMLARASGEADADNCQRLGEALLDVDDATTSVVLDLSALTFIDSSAISELLRIQTELRSRDTAFTVQDPSGAVRRVLEITGLLEIFGLTAS